MLWLEKNKNGARQVHGGDLAAYSAEFPGIVPLDFSANINPLGMPQAVAAALESSKEACTHYPDPLCGELKRALAEYEQVPQGWILCGNGASDLIWRIAWALRARQALLPAPTFLDYQRALEAAGSTVCHHFLSAVGEFQVGQPFLEAISAETGVVFLCNPNNPTGSLAAPELLRKILERCREVGAVLVLDECFLDFVPNSHEHSLIKYLGEYDNLVILKAFTKIFAMPGLRLGYLLSSNLRLLEGLEAMGPTWSVSVPAQLCGIAAVKQRGYLKETRRVLPVWRRDLSWGLAGLGCKVHQSQANYLFFKAAPGLAQRLKPKGILIRDCSNYAGLEPGYFRVAVRTPDENKLLLKGMEAVL